MDSILSTIKKMLGLESDYTVFDVDIIAAINSALMALNQLGVGPSAGFSISDDTATWANLLGAATNLEAVKSYIYLKSRLMFDPPANSSLIEAMQRQIDELSFRLIVQTEPPVI